MDKTYADTVRLLLVVAPEVFRSGPLAMKGGTALNLFVHDMTRQLGGPPRRRCGGGIVIRLRAVAVRPSGCTASG
jgi:hypothetical protein